MKTPKKLNKPAPKFLVIWEDEDKKTGESLTIVEEFETENEAEIFISIIKNIR